MDKKSLFERLKAVFKFDGTKRVFPDIEREYEDEVAKKLALAKEAEALLQNKVMVDVLNSIKADLVRNWKESDLVDSGMREFYYLSYKILEMLESRIKAVCDEALVEQKKLENK